MHHYTSHIEWQRGEQPFTDNRYSRGHDWKFDGGAVVPGSSSPLSVPLPMSIAANVDPEEALVAAASSCHMLVFLWLACKQGYTVDSYRDQAIGILDKIAKGKLAFTLITLRPRIVFSGALQPSAAQLDELHHQAHDGCYIANSLACDIVVEAAT
ncbi:OsmC family protein [Undibacterium sp. TJN25]|uniref:OsmC family protein n=1 Tax=Undibacterium sp. TJN25 TaxID=3413056 RepID=UPI003BF1FEEB